MTAEFNQIPEQCAGRCSLIQEAVDKNRIILSRNCDGPSSKDLAITEKVVIHEGVITEVTKDVTDVSEEYRPACRNRGFAVWLNRLQEDPDFARGLQYLRDNPGE